MDKYAVKQSKSNQAAQKMKTPYIRVIVEKIRGKPYFEIEYYNPDMGETYIGYGSYDMDCVFKWMEDYFEVDEITADVAPVVHSRWVQLNNTQKHYCFECGVDFDLYAYCKWKFNYCPYCGAKMDLEDK